MLVQIYGVTTVEDAHLLNDLGPDLVGVVVDEGVETWDSVDQATARQIVAALPAVRVVALSLSTQRDRVLRTVDHLDPAVLHSARLAEAWEPDQVAALREEIAPVELMLTVPVRGPEAVQVAQRFAGVVDYLLLDSSSSKTGIVGASGETHDWRISRQVVAAVDCPVFLAGGLGPDNVVDAIEAVQPAGVDSETHTSRPADRRRKDLDRVRRFMERARAVGGSG